MKDIDNYRFAETVNNFIESLKKHNDTIEVINVSDTETIIMYESYDHPPIKPHKGLLGLYKRTPEQRRAMSELRKGTHRNKLTQEHKDKISKAMKGRTVSSLTGVKIGAKLRGDNNPMKNPEFTAKRIKTLKENTRLRNEANRLKNS
jgi:hypothetical protein